MCLLRSIAHHCDYTEIHPATGRRPLTTVTFLLLGLSSQIIFQKAIATIDNHMFHYASQNEALTSNISRWALIILKSPFRKTNSINIQGQQVSKIFLLTWILIFVSYSCVLCVSWNSPMAADVRRFTQSCLINPVFIVSYIVSSYLKRRIITIVVLLPGAVPTRARFTYGNCSAFGCCPI